MNIKYIIGILLGSTAISGTAFADGWNGFYIGAQGGYANLPSNAVHNNNCCEVDKDATLNGGLLGIDAGLDHEMANNVVLGVVTDWSISNAAGDGSIYSNNGRPFTLTLHSLGKAQVRAGLTFGEANDNLVYIGGGLAVGNVERTGKLRNGASSNTHLGYVVSAGIEHKLSPSASIKAEAAYVNLGSKVYSAGETVRLGGFVGSVGVNFHF